MCDTTGVHCFEIHHFWHTFATDITGLRCTPLVIRIICDYTLLYRSLVIHISFVKQTICDIYIYHLWYISFVIYTCISFVMHIFYDTQLWCVSFVIHIIFDTIFVIHIMYGTHHLWYISLIVIHICDMMHLICDIYHLCEIHFIYLCHFWHIICDTDNFWYTQFATHNSFWYSSFVIHIIFVFLFVQTNVDVMFFVHIAKRKFFDFKIVHPIPTNQTIDWSTHRSVLELKAKPGRPASPLLPAIKGRSQEGCFLCSG